jgi:hypothetical protein
MAKEIDCPGELKEEGFETQKQAEDWAKKQKCSTKSTCPEKKPCDFGYGAIKKGDTWTGIATCDCPEKPKPKKKSR